MGKIVKTTDFVGKYKVSQNNFAETDLQSFIDKFEKVYIRRLVIYSILILQHLLFYLQLILFTQYYLIQLQLL